jgi:Na+-transporting methylmalonyl-CoA/oxaloacetate decarboxylase gamma subunit
MQTNILILFGVTLLFLGIPIIIPFVARIQKLKHFELAQKVLQVHVVISMFVIFTLAAYFLGIRFQLGEANIVLMVVAAAAYLYLIWSVFQIKPRLLGVTLGIVIGFLFLLVILMSIFGAVMDGKTNRIELASNLYCEASQFGFAGVTSGGVNVSVYRDLGIGISRRLARGSYLDEANYPFDTEEGACKYAMAKVSE